MLPRMQQTLSHLASGPDGGDKKLPSFDELPKFHEMTGCAWDVWGKGDQLGTVNMLTDAVVKRAAQEEIQYVSSPVNVDISSRVPLLLRRTGQAVALNWYAIFQVIRTFLSTNMTQGLSTSQRRYASRSSSLTVSILEDHLACIWTASTRNQDPLPRARYSR